MPLNAVKIGVIASSVVLVCVAITMAVVLLVARKCSHSDDALTCSAACSAGTAGPSCSYSDDITCTSRGIAQEDGTCVCAMGQCGSDCKTPCGNAVPGTWSVFTSDSLEDEERAAVSGLSGFSFGEPEVRLGFTDVDGVVVDNIARTWYINADGTGSVELGFRTLPDGRKEVVFKGGCMGCGRC